jgi:uncharacterized protein (UPF0212 family)
MSLVACKECGGDTSTKASACPKCGAKIPRAKWWLWVPLGLVALLFVFVVFVVVVGNSTEVTAKGNARRAIGSCWKEQKRKSLEPSMQRFVASTCEMMEKKFTEEYGVNP